MTGHVSVDIGSDDDHLPDFARRLPDDCVEYVIYSIEPRNADAVATRGRLNKILKTTQHLAKQHLKDYIWQRDRFQLTLNLDGGASSDPTRKTRSPNSYLKGHTNFGDSIADEWLIVYLLLETSKRHSDAWIRVYDNDGEFLLIEAAAALPKWLNPDIAENRVWINNGHLRIIPLATDTAPGNLDLHDALQSITNRPETLIISPFIETEAFHRIRDYPNAINASLHRSSITIPRKLAYILHHKPSYISPAIEAFYIRDAISVKPLKTKDLATLSFPPEDFVTTSVRFTKVGFAQLQSQVFETPPAWTGVSPRLTEAAMTMGMKLACGFEMLLHDPHQQDHPVVREIKILIEDLERGDDELPTDAEIAAWPQDVDDEKWLDIDYRDFEEEISGNKGSGGTKGKGFGDERVQENLRKMVSRFEEFLNDEDAGVDGVDDDSDEDDDDTGDESDEAEDKSTSFDEADFEKAMREMMGMPRNDIEENGLLDEARKLAIDDDMHDDEHRLDQSEELKEVMRLMEEKLKSRGRPMKKDEPSQAKAPEQTRVVYGPERPPASSQMGLKGKSRVVDLSDEESIGPGDEELSSDDEEDNDVDLELAKNILEAFKGQVGMAGPAGNMMRALGVNMPRDDGD